LPIPPFLSRIAECTSVITIQATNICLEDFSLVCILSKDNLQEKASTLGGSGIFHSHLKKAASSLVV